MHWKNSNLFLLIIWLMGSYALTAKAGDGAILEMEFSPTWENQVTQPGQRQTPELQITRMDVLLSRLALQLADGSWVESENWHAFISPGQNRLRAQADGIPAKTFQAIRFTVGLNETEDRQDPNLVPAGHALHPLTNGLHWGWQGGYVFLALEGRWKRDAATWEGFSYHYARAANAVQVVLPVEFRGGGPVTLSVQWDAAKLLEGLDFNRHGNSTHSRQGDPLVPLLAKNIRQSFQVKAVHYDLYQPTVETALAAPARAAPGTHAYSLQVTRRFPALALPADNPLTEEGVRLGQRLFNDPRLSVNNTQSCATCHQQSAAFGDSRRLSLGAEGRPGRRHSMPLFNLGWAAGFFWDGRAATLRQQVLMPIQDQHEMNESLDALPGKIQDLKPLYKDAFGSAEISAESTALALEQYLLTLISQDSRFDRAVRKQATLTEEEKRGLQLFVTEFDPARGLRGADCFHCHGGTLFTDHQYKNNGLQLAADDLGRMAVTKDTADLGKFKTPSLRNIAVTAPYMHDGRFSTLEEVVEHYSTGVRRSENLDPNLAKHPASGLSLTAQEKHDLVAFLKTLTDESFIGTRPAAASAAETKLAKQP